MKRDLLILASLGGLLAYLLSQSGRRVVSDAGAWVSDQAANLRRGERLNNPGNIEHGDNWQGRANSQPDSRFIAFISPEWGFRAMVRVLQTYADKGLNTVAAIVARWAPAGENPTNTYAATVARNMGVAVNAPLDMRDADTLAVLVKEMARFEQGRMIYPDEVIRRGIEMGIA